MFKNLMMSLAISRWTLFFLTALNFTFFTAINSIRSQVISFGMRKLAYSTNQFGLDLMRAMDRSDTSTAFCPICISSSLVMLLMGSHGTTSSALRHALYLWGMQTSEINLAYYDMMNHLGVNMGSNNLRRINVPSDFSTSLANTDVNSGNDISFLNHIYVQRDFGINYNYHMLLQRFYKTAIHPLDFIENGLETRQHINAIVEKQTMGKIKNILPDRQSSATQLLLISALCFKGTLDLNISSTNSLPTNKQKHTVFGDHVILQAKNVRIRYGFNRYLNCTTIEMPFKGGLITLVAIMPNDAHGLDTLLIRLSAQVLSDVINGLEVRRVNIKLPQLSFEASNRNLSLSLAHLGLSDLFKPGYSQLYDISDYKWLYVSGIIHKTFLEIKENDRILTNNLKTNFSPKDTLDVTLDKPFLFFIMDNVSGLILAMGKHGREPANYRLPI